MKKSLLILSVGLVAQFAMIPALHANDPAATPWHETSVAWIKANEMYITK